MTTKLHLTASSFQTLYNQSSDKVAFLKTWSEDTVVTPERHQALYHHEKNRIFRPSRSEQISGRYSCPYCKSKLSKVRLRKQEHGYVCPRCRWSISQQDLWSPKPDEEPIVREQGDVEDIPTVTDGNDDDDSIGVEDVVPADPLDELGVDDFEPLEILLGDVIEQAIEDSDPELQEPKEVTKVVIG